MRILHTADLHLGQILYQYYDRNDEHLHFFSQLKEWINEYQPDLLVVSGDIFDVAQPSASVWKLFTDAFVEIRNARPEMHIVIVAGNHDSASRLQSHSRIWAFADISVVGTPPPLDFKDIEGWEENFILRLPAGYVIMLPWFSSDRSTAAIALQEYVKRENRLNLPVVMTAHLAVAGCDYTGQDMEIGMLKALDIERLGTDYDYLALGHIHRPQTLSHPEAGKNGVLAPPVARYSGSALHVSCDETYPHSVSLIDIDSHKGNINLKELRIRQLRHFYTLPVGKEAFTDQKQALKYLSGFINENDKCYIRLKFESGTDLSPDFNNIAYDLIEESGKDIRYNPKIIWSGDPSSYINVPQEEEIQLAVEDLQQMLNPLEFINLTADRYDNLNREYLDSAFMEIEEELKSMEEEENLKNSIKKRK